MPLEPGSTLGHYEILSSLGAGGMGEVYRARDTKLGRDVAIKLLLDEVSSDPERVARFEREARVLAALNHPNVATLHGFETEGGTSFLIMELAPGETLADLIARGPMRMEEAVLIFIQIAEGLEAAHERGVIHRDLKPANIKVSEEGRVKILDFGLAKAIHPTTLRDSSLSQSPTLTVAATLPGQIAGTAAYMSPEQARGQSVDSRTDIWAFGAVLFEALTGERPFAGDNVTDVLAAVVREEPDMGRLPESIPGSLRRLVRRCLEKPVRSRLQAIGDARIELGDVLGTPGDETREPSTAESPLSARAVGQVVPWLLAASLALGLLWSLGRSEQREPPRRSQHSVELSPGVRLAEEALDGGAAAVLSPDGSRIAFVGKRGAEAPQLYVRAVNQLEATPIADTRSASDPFFSPDGQWIGFFAEGALKKVPVGGGASVVLADVADPRGASWGEDGTIAFSNVGGGGLQFVRASGGELQQLTSADDHTEDTGHTRPQHLRGTPFILYTATGTFGRDDNARIVLEDRETGERKVLLQGGFHGRYAPSGHLVYLHLETLYALELHLGSSIEDSEVIGNPFPVLEGVRSNSRGLSAQFAISETGEMVYLRGSDSHVAPVHWVNGAGETTLLYAEALDWQNPAFSPDGTRLALSVGDTGLRILDVARGTMSGPRKEPRGSMPVWSPDGDYVVFASGPDSTGLFHLHVARADASDAAQSLTDHGGYQFPLDWHPSGQYVAFVEMSPGASWNVRMLEMKPDASGGWKAGAVSTFLDGPAPEFWTAFSPDGDFVAYSSSETGREEVYVRPFPGPGGVWRVSLGGGKWPVWSRTKMELLFGTLDGRVMGVSYQVQDGEFVPGPPKPWTDRRFLAGQPDQYFDLHPDGERVMMRLADGEGAPSHVVLMTDFFGLLRELGAESR